MTAPAKWTPGPWYVGESMVGHERPHGICRSVDSGDPEEPTEETIAEVCPTSDPATALADAHLIAAAPALAEACEAALTALDRMAQGEDVSTVIEATGCTARLAEALALARGDR